MQRCDWWNRNLAVCHLFMGLDKGKINILGTTEAVSLLHEIYHFVSTTDLRVVHQKLYTRLLASSSMPHSSIVIWQSKQQHTQYPQDNVSMTALTLKKIKKFENFQLSSALDIHVERVKLYRHWQFQFPVWTLGIILVATETHSSMNSHNCLNSCKQNS